MRHAASHLKQIVSGAQTGVDRAALDAAMRAGLTVGGWCPRGRKAEDGVIPDIYPLKETRGAAYRTRTRWNVRDADATLILCRGEPSGGTLLTVGFCEELGKPYRIERLRTPEPATRGPRRRDRMVARPPCRHPQRGRPARAQGCACLRTRPWVHIHPACPPA